MADIDLTQDEADALIALPREKPTMTRHIIQTKEAF